MHAGMLMVDLLVESAKMMSRDIMRCSEYACVIVVSACGAHLD